MSTNKIWEKLDKEFGGSVLFRADESMKMVVDVVPFPSPSLNEAVGFGGLPRGRISQFHGPEGCLDGETFLNYSIWSETGKRKNHKGGTLEHLYERFHNIQKNGKGYTKGTETDFYTAASIDEDQRVFHNKILDVVKTGQKECFELVTVSGETIVCTAEHKFWTGTSFAAASELNVGSNVFIHNNTPYRKDSVEKMAQRSYIFVKAHPIAGVKKIKSGNKTYIYHRLLRSRAVAEATMNNLDLKTYISRLNAGTLSGLKFLPRDLHVHHLDENVLNDDIDNLSIVVGKEHNRTHALKENKNLRYVAIETSIASIEPVGIKNTYDLKMEAPHNNYVANGFVVHNSGKTAFAMLMVKEFQEKFPESDVLWIDAEFSFDTKWANNLGIDLTRLRIIRENNGAAVFTMLCGKYNDKGKKSVPGVLDLIASKDLDVQLIVLDSIAMLIPPVEHGRGFEEQEMAALARLLPKGFRATSELLSKSNCAMICINQAREKIGERIPTLTYPGGRSYRHSLSLAIEFVGSTAKDNVLFDSRGEKVGHRMLAKVQKTRGGPDKHKASFFIDFTKGVVKIGEELATLGDAYGVISRPSTVTWEFEGQSFKGKNAFYDFLDENPEARDKIVKEIQAAKERGVDAVLPTARDEDEVILEDVFSEESDQE